jgi:uncharacterized protein (UPF0335 family)
MPRGRPKKEQSTPKEDFNNGASSVERLDLLPALATKIDGAKRESDEARDDLDGIYKQAEDDGFHKRALKEAMRLRGMEPAKRRDYLSSLNAYCDKLGIWDQGDLLDPEPRTPGPPDLIDADDSGGSIARGVGRSDGLAGNRAGEHLYPQDSAFHAAYEFGWQEGQRALVEQHHGVDMSSIRSNGSSQETANT